MRFLACLLAPLLALTLAGCDPSGTTGANAGITVTSSTLHSLCGTAEAVLPIVSAYFQTGKHATQIAAANNAVAAYCAGPISTDVPSAVRNLTAALAPLLPLVIKTPAALAAFRQTPVGRHWHGWENLRT